MKNVVLQEDYKKEFENEKAKNKYLMTDTPAYDVLQDVEKKTADVRFFLDLIFYIISYSHIKHYFKHKADINLLIYKLLKYQQKYFTEIL